MAAGVSPWMLLVMVSPPERVIFTSAFPECWPQSARALHNGSRRVAGSEAGRFWNQHLKVLEPPLITRVFTGTFTYDNLLR